jgi:hypothetical protein
MNKKHKVYKNHRGFKYSSLAIGTLREIIKGEWTPHGTEVKIRYK